MKKIIALFFVCMCLFSTVACDVKPSDFESTTSDTTESILTDTNKETESENMAEVICEHDFKPATCNVPEVCKLCGKKQGEKLGHKPGETSCLKPTVCERCDTVIKSQTGHDYVNKVCTHCGEIGTWIACVGDSITAGGYWKLMKNHLSPSYIVNGFGVSGSTGYAAGLDGDPPNQKPLAYVDQEAHQKAKESNADVYVIMLGTNDSKPMNADRIKEDNGAQYKADMIAQINEYKSLSSNPQIFVALPPVSYRPETKTGMSNVNIETLIIPLLKSAAEETGAIIIDTHEATKNQSAAFPDGVHPNAAGQNLLAKTIADAILAANSSGVN